MKKFILLFFIGAIALTACKKDEIVQCSSEFKTVSIGVVGAKLDTFFTVRTAKFDTIKYDKSKVLVDKFYPVLDDSYLSKIKNSQDNFIFVGINKDTIIKEPFIIGADGCHVFKVTGKAEVDISKQ